MSAHVLCHTENTIASDMEQATGLERKELEALMQGKEVSPIDAHYIQSCTCVYYSNFF